MKTFINVTDLNTHENKIMILSDTLAEKIRSCSDDVRFMFARSAGIPKLTIKRSKDGEYSIKINRIPRKLKKKFKKLL